MTASRLLALAVVAAGAALRFSGLGWDEGHLFHPDERNLVDAVMRLRLFELRDPGFYAYNGLSLYLVRALVDLGAWLAGEPAWRDSAAFVSATARCVSALASSLTIGLAWALGRAIADEGLGVLLAALFAFDVGFVQAAHFGTTESVLVLLLLGLALVAARFVQRPERWRRHAVVSGVLVGLAFGTKTSGIAFALVAGVALSFAAPGLGLRRSLVAAALAGSAALAVALATSPHSFVYADRFLAAMRYEHAVVTGSPVVFYTLSFRDGSALLHLDSLHWLCGPLVPALGLAGSIALAADGIRGGRSRGALPLLAFSAAYALYIAGWHARFVRYLLPLLPALLLGAGWLIHRIARSPGRRGLGVLLGSLAVLSSVLWTLAFASVYARPSTRLSASAWLVEHAAVGSVILNERRDYPLPVGGAGELAIGLLDGFARDSAGKLEATARGLADADYWVLASDRVHRVTRAHPEAYPLTGALYAALFDGSLGYLLAARFESEPALFGLTLRDDGAEETFRVFDHPTVWIFRNAVHKSAAEIAASVRAGAPALSPPPAWYQPDGAP